MVDPYTVNVDEVNERKQQALALGDLEKSIAEIGIVQPPIVRVRDEDAEVPYAVVIGQRRVMAAQGLDLDEIPVVIMDWDDEEAIKASISENMDLFREKVGGKDRARALERLWFEMGGEGMPSASVLSDELGVPRQTISNWVEYLRSEYEGTPIDPHYISNEEDDDHRQMSINVDEVGETTLQQIRSATGGGEKAVEIAREVDQGNLTETVRGEPL
jgi:ParB/RepB/Spo0J family partition protein